MMKKLELRFKLILIFITAISVLAQAQEICTNGIDDDGDGLIDCRDCSDCAAQCTVYDWDNDGINNYCDLDDDNDGIPDENECQGVFYGPELIQNGNFENGYAHWTSDFNRGKNNFAATGGGCGGQGWVALSPCASMNGSCFDYYNYNGGVPNGQTIITDNLGTGANVITTSNCNSTNGTCLAQSLPDHTTGSGLSLYVDPNDIPGQSYWKQSVTIQPNKYYEFSAWIMVIEEDPELVFRINNTNLTDIFNLDRQTGGNNGADIWQPVMTTWFSGSASGNVTIELVNIVAGCNGNDLRLDDISFREIINFCDDDGDGIANIYDLDSDNDGIYDLNEAGHNAPDSNNDGVIDGSNASFGSNGLHNSIETFADSDFINYTLKNSESTPNGKLDAYVLDADGDGCFDAKEENIPDSDGDGIAGTGTPTITTKGLVSTHTYTAPSINEWQNPLQNVNCPENCTNRIDDDGDGLVDCDDPDCSAAISGNLDTDNDGIINFCDEDDDNDGILDGEENACGALDAVDPSASAASVGGPFFSSDLTTINGQTFTWKTVSVTPSSGDPHYIRSNGNVAYPSGNPNQTPTSTGKSFNVQVIFPTSTRSFQIRAFDFDGPNKESIENFSIQPTQLSSNARRNSGKITSKGENQDINLIWNLPNPVNTITFTVKRPSKSFGISFRVGFPFCDVDGDGIIDSQDLDSDGDGCPDVVESGGIDANNDGILDGVGVNADGLVTGGSGGYDGLNGDEIRATQMTITSPPTDRTKNVGESTTFSVTARSDAATSYNSGTPVYGNAGNDNSRLRYQWYIGNPNTTGTPISNGGIYNGATTNTLTVSDVTGLNGTQYYVLVTHRDNPCLEEIRSATLYLNEFCTDGIDNDGDGLIDCDDPDCTAAISGELDTDNDGVIDFCDEDDDNDGILDVDEGCDDVISGFPNADKAYLFQNRPTDIYTIDIQTGDTNLITTLNSDYNAFAINEADGLIWCIDHLNNDILTTLNPYNFNVVNTFGSHHSVTAAYDPIRKVYVLQLNVSAGDIVVIDADPQSSNYGSELYRFPYLSGVNNCADISYNSTNGFMYGISNSTNELIQIDIINQTTTSLGAVSGLPSGLYGAIYSLFDGRMFLGNNATGEIYLVDLSVGLSASLYSTAAPAGFNDGAKVLSVDLNGNLLCLDTDNDGIPNSKDLDSDADGCNDVLEIGGIDANNDGQLDGTGVTNQGRVIGGTGGYTSSNGNEILAHQLTITTPPSDVTKNTGEAHNISVVASAEVATNYSNGTPFYTVNGNANNNINYQWYLGNPNTTGTPITNIGIYNGTTTNTLSISDVTGLNGTQYCVRVTHQNNPCIEEVRCMILSVNTTEICDDGQDNDGDGLIDCADPDCSPVIADVVPTDLVCPLGNANGQIVITATGPGTLTYSITNEPNYQSSNTFSNLGQGLYTIRVQSSTGCVDTYDAAVIQLDTPACPEICDDGIDNDGDGLVDCDDSDCGVNATPNIVEDN